MKDKSSRESKNYFKLNENKTYQNWWDAVKAVLREKFIVLNAYIKKEERSYNDNLRELEEQV